MKIFIVGGSREVIELVQIIRREIGLGESDFVVITDNQKDAEAITREFDIPVFTGDLFDERLYLEVGIDKADVVIAAHENDMVNAFVSMLAKEIKIPKIVVAVSNSFIGKFLKNYGIATEVIDKSKEVSKSILEKTLNAYIVDAGEKHIVIHNVTPNSRIASKTVKELEDDGIKVVAAIREGSVKELKQDTLIEVGDTVIILIDKTLTHKLFSD